MVIIVLVIVSHWQVGLLLDEGVLLGVSLVVDGRVGTAVVAMLVMMLAVMVVVIVRVTMTVMRLLERLMVEVDLLGLGRLLLLHRSLSYWLLSWNRLCLRLCDRCLRRRLLLLRFWVRSILDRHMWLIARLLRLGWVFFRSRWRIDPSEWVLLIDIHLDDLVVASWDDLTIT